jgi:hypothetical protein
LILAEPSPLSTPLKKASQFLQRPDNSTLPAALSPTVSETNSLPNGYGDHDDDADGSSSIDSRSIPNDSPVKATQVEDRLSSPASKNPVDEEAENISGNSSPSKSSQEYSDCLNQSSEADKSPDIRSLQAPSEVESNFGSAEGDIIGENQIINVRNSSLSFSVSCDKKGEELIGGPSSSNNNRIEQEEVDPVDRIRDMPDGDGKERAVTVEENGSKELSPCKIDGSYSDVADRLTEFQDTYDDFQQSSDEQTKGTKPHNFENQDSLLKSVEDDTENFGDFEAFQSSTFDEPPSSLQSDIPGEGSGEMKTSYIGEVDEEDDGFGDFSSIPPVASSSAPSLPQPQEQTSSIQPSAQIEDDDDFSDFQDFQEPPTPLHVEPSTSSSSSAAFNQFVLSPRTSLDFSAALESKFENLIKTVIPKSENAAPLETHTEQEESKSHTDFKSIDNEMSKSSDSYWSHVQDFEESKGLLHKWLNSLSQQKMYKSLRIDTSNIVSDECDDFFV